MTRLERLRPFLLQSTRNIYHNYRLMSKLPENENSADEETKSNKEIGRPMFIPDNPLTVDDIDEPTNCCMSGCANCVWIEYAERLSEVLKGSPGEVQKMIMDKVQDPNMRAFLSMELRVRNLIK